MCIYTKYKSVLIIFIVCSSFVHTYLFFCSIRSPSLFVSQCVDLFCYFFLIQSVSLLLFRSLPLSLSHALTHSFTSSIFLSVGFCFTPFVLVLVVVAAVAVAAAFVAAEIILSHVRCASSFRVHTHVHKHRYIHIYGCLAYRTIPIFIAHMCSCRRCRDIVSVTDNLQTFHN